MSDQFGGFRVSMEQGSVTSTIEPTMITLEKGDYGKIRFDHTELQTLIDALKWAKGRLLVRMRRKFWHEIDPELAHPRLMDAEKGE